VVSEISRINRFVFVVLARYYDLAQIQKACVGVNQYAIVGEIAVVGIVESGSKFHPPDVSQEQSVVPLQKLLLGRLLKQHSVGLCEFSGVLTLHCRVELHLISGKSLSAKLSNDALLKPGNGLVLLMIAP
jgi:hypothetical protein